VIPWQPMNGPLGVRRLVDDAGELLNGAAKMEAHHTRMAERAKGARDVHAAAAPA